MCMNMILWEERTNESIGDDDDVLWIKKNNFNKYLSSYFGSVTRMYSQIQRANEIESRICLSVDVCDRFQAYFTACDARGH